MLSGLEGPTLLSALPRAGQDRCAIALVMLSAAQGGGACHRARRRLPGRDSHPQVECSFQDAPRSESTGEHFQPRENSRGLAATATHPARHWHTAPAGRFGTRRGRPGPTVRAPDGAETCCRVAGAESGLGAREGNSFSTCAGAAPATDAPRPAPASAPPAPPPHGSFTPNSAAYRLVSFTARPRPARVRAQATSRLKPGLRSCPHQSRKSRKRVAAHPAQSFRAAAARRVLHVGVARRAASRGRRARVRACRATQSRTCSPAGSAAASSPESCRPTSLAASPRAAPTGRATWTWGYSSAGAPIRPHATGSTSACCSLRAWRPRSAGVPWTS